VIDWRGSFEVAHMIRKCRHRLLALAATAVSVFAGLLCAEVILRVLDLPFAASSTPNETRIGQFDEELGWVYVPNISTVRTLGSEQREFAMHFDSDGARIETPSQPYDHNVPSVIFVGGSFTMGHGLPYDETFIGRLNKMNDFPYQAVNFGVEGYGTDQAFLKLKRVIKKFRVKAVIYTFIGAHVKRNADNDRRLLWPESRFIGTKPLFGLDSSGQLYLKSHPYKYEDVIELRLWQLLQQSWVLAGPPPTFDLTDALICAMKDFAEAEGARFILVHWRQGGASSVWGNEPIDISCGQVFDLGNEVQEDWQSWIIPGDGHPSRRAHGLAAQVIADHLRAVLRH
jgi:hypothetical protein